MSCPPWMGVARSVATGAEAATDDGARALAGNRPDNRGGGWGAVVVVVGKVARGAVVVGVVVGVGGRGGRCSRTAMTGGMAVGG